MSVASTYFIKAQIPGTTLQKLVSLYEREISIQGAGQTAIFGNVISFSGTSDFSRYKHFAGFTDGQLIIEETEKTFDVSLEGNSSRFLILFDVFFENLRNTLERELQS